MCEIKVLGCSSESHEEQSLSDFIPWLMHGHLFCDLHVAFPLYVSMFLSPLYLRTPVSLHQSPP